MKCMLKRRMFVKHVKIHLQRVKAWKFINELTYVSNVNFLHVQDSFVLKVKTLHVVKYIVTSLNF